MNSRTVAHVDVSIKQMLKIMKEHKKNPDKDFYTHPDYDENEKSNNSSQQRQS